MTVYLQVIIEREFPPIYLNLYCIRTNLELLRLRPEHSKSNGAAPHRFHSTYLGSFVRGTACCASPDTARNRPPPGSPQPPAGRAAAVVDFPT